MMLQTIRRFFGRRRRARLRAGPSGAERGRFGEMLADDYCRNELGFRVLARNWRCRPDELDLVCRDGEVLVFIEVRARAENAAVPGYFSVTRDKKKTLRRACGNYLKQLKKPPAHFRFDIIEISVSKEGAGVVRHYANIPLFNKHFSVQRQNA
ncbi:MAG: YraN family protein [Opitutales bacterium]